MLILRIISVLASLIFVVTLLLGVRLAYNKGHRGDLTMPVTLVMVTLVTILLIVANFLVFRLQFPPA